ncbi:unnamed protein product, partial [Gadus morhua 'NCC']
MFICQADIGVFSFVFCSLLLSMADTIQQLPFNQRDLRGREEENGGGRWSSHLSMEEPLKIFSETMTLYK